ncbi:ATP-dependent Clp protease proteolytic subunit [Mesorhizobium sp.]|uniref:ATP-dependent Clp protease proteolytic subunit n=1 Tax=Mesorhizobium sp. TaxID=1871066 RepID=UPI0025BFC182|nr:ATP-dependent Clp protease proteolytic subunit [Mesorhizobium sp.]
MDRPSPSNQQSTRGPDRHRLLLDPNLRIHGLIDDRAVMNFLADLKEVRNGENDLYVEIDTPGGDADGARRMALEIKLFLKHSGRAGYVIGKNTVYSAGITVLAAFPKSSRYLCPQAVLLIHERRLEKNLVLNGPIRGCLQIIREQLALLQTAEQLEDEGFADLVRGSRFSLDELRDHAMNSCYLSAEKALELELVQDIAD